MNADLLPEGKVVTGHGGTGKWTRKKVAGFSRRVRSNKAKGFDNRFAHNMPLLFHLVVARSAFHEKEDRFWKAIRTRILKHAIKSLLAVEHAHAGACAHGGWSDASPAPTTMSPPRSSASAATRQCKAPPP